MKVYDRISVDKWFLSLVGVVLLVVSGSGVAYGGRAAMASWLSFRAQYGSPPATVEQVLIWCREAYSLYPQNYFFSIFSAETAYYQANEVHGDARVERLRQARLWCDRGLAQNVYKSQLRRLKTRFLWEESPMTAIAYWEAYTDWQFWEPYNHATLAELYARAGEMEKAERSLKWVEGDSSYAQVKETVEREKQVWADLMDEKTGSGANDGTRTRDIQNHNLAATF